jgi:UDP-glucose 4-epimerase
MTDSGLGMHSLQGTTTLIIGGAGFVGSNLTQMLLDQGAADITVVDNLLSSDADNIVTDPRVKFIFGSITDSRILEQLRKQYDYVFHLACYHGNQSSIANPMADLENNLLPSLVLFDYLASKVATRKVVYAAAGCSVAPKIFGEATPTAEDAPVSLFQDSPYSISKLAGELYGNYFWSSQGLPVVRARFQNVYGPREVLGAGQWRGTPATVWRNVVPTFIWRALLGMPLMIDGGGRTSRDFIYVEDLCLGLVSCAVQGRPGEAYNLSSGRETTIGKLAELIVAETASESSIVASPRRGWDNSGNRVGDPSKSEHELGFAARTSIQEGLRETIRWTSENRSRIAGSIERHSGMIRRLGASS